MTRFTRRGMMGALGAGLLLPGCDRVAGSETFGDALYSVDAFTRRMQRLVTNRHALAREYSEADMSPIFRSNGTRMPDSPEYQAHAAAGFADWRLVVDGLVARPLALPLAQIRAMPARTQITRHDCVEGWSAIGKWTGVPLKDVLEGAEIRSDARYIVFHCADDFSGTPYYESLDIIEAYHPQTILAWGMNDRMLPIPHGAPLRLRAERQLGYKHAKYVMRVEAVHDLRGIGQGKGGFWEDRSGYEWWAGI